MNSCSYKWLPAETPTPPLNNQSSVLACCGYGLLPGSSTKKKLHYGEKEHKKMQQISILALAILIFLFINIVEGTSKQDSVMS